MTPTRDQIFAYLDWQDRTDAAIAHEVDSICAASPLVAAPEPWSFELSPAQVVALSEASDLIYAQDEPASLRRYLSEDRKPQAEFKNKPVWNNEAPPLFFRGVLFGLAFTFGVAFVVWFALGGWRQIWEAL